MKLLLFLQYELRHFFQFLREVKICTEIVYGKKILGSQFGFEWVWNIIQKSLKKDPSVFDKQDKKPQTKNSNLSGNLIGQMTKITLNEKK